MSEFVLCVCCHRKVSSRRAASLHKLVNEEESLSRWVTLVPVIAAYYVTHMGKEESAANSGTYLRVRRRPIVEDDRAGATKERKASMEEVLKALWDQVVESIIRRIMIPSAA